MKIDNAIINDVIVCIDDRDRLAARMTFESRYGCCSWGFVLTDSADVQRLKKLMSYADVYDIKHLNGKIIRMVSHENYFRGFGHIIEDKFIPAFGNEFNEINETQFQKLLVAL